MRKMENVDPNCNIKTHWQARKEATHEVIGGVKGRKENIWFDQKCADITTKII